MKSNKKQQNTKTKEIKSKKKISPKPVEPEFESTSMNYFRMLKELEKQNSEQKLSEELEQKEKNINKPKQKNLTEIIYEKNSKKLGNYYNKNQKDLLLYGSSKYDILSMDKVLKEMGNYQAKVINKINESNKNNISDSQIKEIIDDYDNYNNRVILTPLAENEKERNEMEALEKKNFDEAKRMGVVMRRIEYTNLLNQRKNLNDNEDNKEFIEKLRDSANTIGNCWLRYKRKKNIKKKMNARRGHIEITYLASNDNIKRLEILGKKYEELYKKYLEDKNEISKLNNEKMELQQLLEDNNSSNIKQINNMNKKYQEKENELSILNKAYDDLLDQKNILQENHNKLMEDKMILNNKYNEMVESLNKQNEEFNNIKIENQTILRQKKQSDEKNKEKIHPLINTCKDN